MSNSKAEPKYKKGEKVLCYEPDPIKQPIIYHSVIMEVDHEDVSELLEDNDPKKGDLLLQPIYLVHFQNWGSQYDRWVTEDLVLHITPENLATKEHLDKQVVGPKNPSKKRTSKKTEKTSETSDSAEARLSQYKMNLDIPATIKQALERDFVNVTLRNLLVNLPRTPNVETILLNFVESTLANNPTEDKDSLLEFSEGIITCFDFTLPLQLLYKEERSQLEREGFSHSGSRIKRQNLTSQVAGDWVMYPGYSLWGKTGEEPVPGPLRPSKLYGAEHLLRLFVKLPELLNHMEMDYLRNVTYFSQSFLEYVAKHRAEVFVEIQPYKEAELCDLG